MSAIRKSARGQSEDVVGKRTHMLVVVERLPGSIVRCQCDCGKMKDLHTGHFNTGKMKSCGCHVRRHGMAHYRNRSRTYIAYYNMVARCHKKTNKRYCDYGARGVNVCTRWLEDFRYFLADMGECPDGFTIDRIDNRRGYSPDNCRWTDRRTNQRNRFVSKRWVVYGAAFESLDEAAKAEGVSMQTIRARCCGRTADGRWYPPKPGHSVRDVYE